MTVPQLVDLCKELLVHMRTKFGTHIGGEPYCANQKFKFTRNDSVTHAQVGQPLFIVVLQGAHPIYDRGDVIKSVSPYAGPGATKDNVCFNLVREHPTDIKLDEILNDIGELEHKTRFQKGFYKAYTRYVIDNNLEEAGGDGDGDGDGDGGDDGRERTPPPPDPTLVNRINELTRELTATNLELADIKDYARSIFTATNRNAPATLFDVDEDSQGGN